MASDEDGRRACCATLQALYRRGMCALASPPELCFNQISSIVSTDVHKQPSKGYLPHLKYTHSDAVCVYGDSAGQTDHVGAAECVVTEVTAPLLRHQDGLLPLL